MTDYVKREDVDTYFNNRNAWYNFYETLESIPSADVKPVRHGRWIQDGHHIRCSECGTYFCRLDREGNSIPREYCPCCGAKMDEVLFDNFDYWEESGAADAYADHQR